MRCSSVYRGALAVLCLLLAGCNAAKPSAGRTPEVLPDTLEYRGSPSPIEKMRNAGAEVTTLSVGEDGTVRYTRSVDGMGFTSESQMTPVEKAKFFDGLNRDGVTMLDKYPQISREPLASNGRMCAGRELKVRLAGKTYRFYWSDGGFPTEAQPLWARVEAVLAKARTAEHRLAEAP